MESGKSFSCKVVSYDRKRKKGGVVLHYPEAELVKASDADKEDSLQRMPTKMEQQHLQIEAIKRNPHHKKWYTRNIRILQDGFPTAIIKTIHPPLLIEFNGQNVFP